MDERYERQIPLLGYEAMKRLNSAKVIIFGCGGVGGYIAEMLARSGIGQIDLVDNDIVSITNINRQIIALESTIGKNKTDVLKNRILDINPQCVCNTHQVFVTPDNINLFDFSIYNYVIDAVDTISAKLAIIQYAKLHNIKIISAMGAGNKLNPMMFEIKDINQTSVCPLARVMRHELKKRGIANVKVCYSKEEPIKSSGINIESKKTIPASICFVPSVCGILIAKEVIMDIGLEEEEL